MEKKNLLELKKKMNKRRPEFKRQDTHMRARLSRTGWRRPRGMHSKMKIEEKSKYRRVKIGYCSPKAVRGLHISGKEFLRVFNMADLEKADAAKHILIIASTTGTRKKLLMLAEAQKRGLEVENLDLKKFEEKIKAQREVIKENQKARKAKKDKKVKKALEKEKKKAEKETKKEETKVAKKKSEKEVEDVKPE